MHFGNNVRALRKAKQLTQTQLAEMCNTTATTISRLEANEAFPRKHTIEKISDCLGVSIAELMSDVGTYPMLDEKIAKLEHEFNCRCRTVEDMREYNASIDLINYAQGFRDGIEKALCILVQEKE